MTMRNIGGPTILGITLALFGCSDDDAGKGGGGDNTGTGGTSSGTGTSGGTGGTGDGGTDDGGSGDGASGGSSDDGSGTSGTDDGGTSGTSSGGTTTADTSGTGGTGGTDTGVTTATGGTTGTGATTGTGSATGTGTGGLGCINDQDCIGDPAGEVCNTITGDCVECLPTNDPCPIGHYCDDVNLVCITGCLDDNDCQQPLFCDEPNNLCVGCVIDNDCALGSVCDQGSCIPGCNAQQPCPPPQACCPDDQCYNLTNDEANCGACGFACPPDPPDAEPFCNGGDCEIICDGGSYNCNLDDADGCEAGVTCTCDPGETRDCYYGPPGTEGVGICHGGTETCDDDGLGWGPCDGQVLPNPAGEICDNGLNDDCDADGVDEDPDDDGDGYSVCEGDCCDVAGPDCMDPALVNPGAFEVDGNDVDDDCDGTKDNPLPLCDDGGLSSNSSDPLDYARAIDLCQFPNPADPADQRWGVLGGAFTRSNGAGSPSADARSIRDGFGSNVATWNNASTMIAVLSTGHAADATDTSPNYAPFQSNIDVGADAAVPADWLAANGNNFPNAPGCPDPQGGTTGNNTIQLSFNIRVPTNANSFKVRMFFYSAEYPEWVCSAFNDFFLTLVDSAAANNPADKNIAIYDNGVSQWPVGVNLVGAAQGLFTACQPDANQPTGCGGGAVPGTYSGCVSTTELVGTGFDPVGTPPPQFPGDPGVCEPGDQVGGGTGWLTMSGNVFPGETATIRFVIWDTGDPYYDSLVLLDAWEWSVDASEPGVTPG